MARDIGGGYVLVTPKLLGKLTLPQLEKLGFELDRRTRDIRSQQPDASDITAVQQRNRQIQRLTAARRMLEGDRRKRRV